MGRYYIEEDPNNPGVLIKRYIDGSYVQYNTAPIGTIEIYGGTTLPPGWLWCNGQAVSRSYYTFLFAAIGTTYGSGDGSTTFNVPTLSNFQPNMRFMIKSESTIDGHYLGIKGGGEEYADNPLGTILSYGGTTAPDGWFLCHGQALSRTEYSELFAVIGTSFGTGDGSTTFNLPDLRGEFLRGAGTNSHTNTYIGEREGDGGTVGQHQNASALPAQYVWHAAGSAWSIGAYSNIGDANGQYTANGTSDRVKSVPTISNVSIQATGSAASNGSVWATTRPTNTSVNFIIKAKKTAVPIDMLSALNSIAESKIAALNLGAFYYSNMISASNPSWGDVTYTFATPVPPGKYLVDIRCNNTTNTDNVAVIANLAGSKLGETVLQRTNWSGQGVMHMDGAPLNIATATSSITGQVAILQAVSVQFQLHLTKIA